MISLTFPLHAKCLIDSINRQGLCVCVCVCARVCVSGGESPDAGAFRGKSAYVMTCSSDWLNEPGSELDNLLFPYYFPLFNSLCASSILYFPVCVCMREGETEGNISHCVSNFTAILDPNIFYHPPLQCLLSKRENIHPSAVV